MSMLATEERGRKARRGASAPRSSLPGASLMPQDGHFWTAIDTCVAVPPQVAALRRNRWPKSSEYAIISTKLAAFPFKLAA